MEVRIQRFETQYRLAPWALAEQRRLDQVRPIVLDKAFERALVGMPEDAELCIRNLFVPVRLSLRDSDASIITSWSVALGEEIVRALRHGSTTNVVVYHSRRQALMDMALGVARGDLSRVWAWRQLGLWRPSDVCGESEAVSELVRALSEARAIMVPVLNALARAGWLQRIARRLTAEQWEQLAWAALSEAGAEHLLAEAAWVPSTRTLADARRLLGRSFLLQSITLSSGATRSTRRAIAALAVLDDHPGLLRTETAQALIGIVANAITDSMTSTSSEMVDASLETSAAAAVEFEPANLLVDQPAGNSTDSAGGKAGDSTAREAPDRPFTVTPPTGADVAKSAVRPAAGIPVANHKGDGEAEFDSVGRRNSEQTEPLDLRRRAFTRSGGLLFLLAVVEDLKVPEEIMAHALLGSRPFLWVIHQLALALATVAEQDPAALAFAGLPPDQRPPFAEEAAPSQSEAGALSALVARVVARLRLMLEDEDRPEASLLEFVCRRRAEIVTDPGWIEVRLSLDDVDTEIRRAGLDLNPGYVPWLGVVVVFVYE